LKNNAEWVDKKEWVKVGDVECLANVVDGVVRNDSF
jgi:hypothetical protein